MGVGGNNTLIMKEFIQGVLDKYNYYMHIKDGTRTEIIIVCLIVLSWLAIGILNLYLLVQYSLYVLIFIPLNILFFLFVIFDKIQFSSKKSKRDFLGNFRVFYLICTLFMFFANQRHSTQICKFIYGGEIKKYSYIDDENGYTTGVYLKTENKNYREIDGYIGWFLIIIILMSNWFFYQFKYKEIEEESKKEKDKEDREVLRDWILSRLQQKNKTE